MSAWTDQFKVGDVVEFELARDVEGAPRWNCSEDYGASGVIVSGTVHSVCTADADTRPYIVVTAPEVASWAWEDPGTDVRPGYVRLKASVAKAEPAIIYRVQVPKPYPNEEVPDSVFRQLVDAGERGVRRVLRYWPDGKELRYQRRGDEIVWFFREVL